MIPSYSTDTPSVPGVQVLVRPRAQQLPVPLREEIMTALTTLSEATTLTTNTVLMM